MNTRRARPIDSGSERARYLAIRFGQELRIARVTAGLTQAMTGRLAGVCQQTVSGVERGNRHVSLLVRCRLAAACGCELGWRLHPVASVRLRDSGQLAIAEAIGRSSAPVWRVAFEVPVGGRDDRRAADVVLSGTDELIQIEIERSLVDFQAQSRKGQLKRDALAVVHRRPVRLVIAVPDTKRSRDLIAALPPHVRSALPVPSASIWRAIRNGTAVGGDGILFVRPDRTRRR